MVTVVVGASVVVGATVVGAGIGTSVVGATVVGASVVVDGATVTGASVVVVGAAVVAASFVVVGATVVGAAVTGGGVVVDPTTGAAVVGDAVAGGATARLGSVWGTAGTMMVRSGSPMKEDPGTESVVVGIVSRPRWVVNGVVDVDATTGPRTTSSRGRVTTISSVEPPTGWSPNQVATLTRVRTTTTVQPNVAPGARAPERSSARCRSRLHMNSKGRTNDSPHGHGQGRITQRAGDGAIAHHDRRR